MTDWTLIKTQYEIQGATKEQLCEEHDISMRVLTHAITADEWSPPSPPTTCDDKDDGSETEIEQLNASAALAHARHQAALIPKYIQIENTFLDNLRQLAGSLFDADDAKKIAETLALLKPVIMKQADTDKASVGGNRIMVVNQFPVPQPGDEHYIAPNAVLIGDAAGKENSVVAGADYQVIEVPEYGEMN